MKNCKKHLVIALIVLTMGQFLAPMSANAQVLEVGGSVGLSYYMGDINPNKPFVQSDLGWGALVRYYDGTRWAFRFTYSNLNLKNSDKASGYRPERGLSFNTKVHDFALLAEFNFFDYFTGSKRNGFSPYIFGGMSVLRFNPKADDGTELYNILTDTDSDKSMPSDSTYSAKYNRVAVSIPFGIGVKYSVSNRLGLALEWRWNLALTDWIDDCHAYYPQYTENDPFVNYSDPTGFAADADGANKKSYIQRGNKADFDWYGYLNISITYKFNLPNGDDCNKRERYKNYD